MPQPIKRYQENSSNIYEIRAHHSYTRSRDRPGKTQQTGIFCGKSFIAYIFRSQRARGQEQESKKKNKNKKEKKNKNRKARERKRTRTRKQEREKEQESKRENKNKKARERKRMAKPCPF